VVSEEIFEEVDHCQLVWTISRVLRPTFRRDRLLLGELVRCAWTTLKESTQAKIEAYSRDIPTTWQSCIRCRIVLSFELIFPLKTV